MITSKYYCPGCEQIMTRPSEEKSLVSYCAKTNKKVKIEVVSQEVTELYYLILKHVD
jgi:hypothetical protein